MKPELQLINDFSKLLNRMPNCQGHGRIENSINTGTPDYYYTIDGIHGFIEFKVANLPKKTDKTIKLNHFTASQQEWFRVRLNSPTIFLICRVGEFDFIFDTSMIFQIDKIEINMLMAYNWKESFKNKTFWTNQNLLLLSNKLKGLKA